MKKALFNTFLAGIAISFVLTALFAWKPEAKDNATAPKSPDITTVTTDAQGELVATGTTFYQYTYALDTIANAANDTLQLPLALRPLASDFLITYTITRTNISGTTNLAVKVETTNWAYSGTTAPTQGWVAALNSAGSAAATAATTATTEAFFIPNAYGINYRIIVDGTGTQSTSYRIRVTLKKKT